MDLQSYSLSCSRDWKFITQKTDIDESVPGGSGLEVYPAPVDACLLPPDVVHHEGGRRAVQVEVGSLSKLELVAPSCSMVPGQFPRIITKTEIRINIHDPIIHE